MCDSEVGILEAVIAQNTAGVGMLTGREISMCVHACACRLSPGNYSQFHCCVTSLRSVFPLQTLYRRRKGAQEGLEVTCGVVFALQYCPKPVPLFFHVQCCKKMLVFQVGCKLTP